MGSKLRTTESPDHDESMDKSNVSMDSKLTMKTVGGQFRKPVKISFKDEEMDAFANKDGYRAIRNKLNHALKF